MLTASELTDKWIVTPSLMAELQRCGRMEVLWEKLLIPESRILMNCSEREGFIQIVQEKVMENVSSRTWLRWSKLIQPHSDSTKSEKQRRSSGSTE